MDKIQKEVNDCNKEVVKELSILYNKLSESLDKSYYYGQKSGYEEILAWFKQPQNKSNKYISPKIIKNYLIEKGAKSKIILNEKTQNNYNNGINTMKEEIKKKPNRAGFNYLFYNQTFNNNDNNMRINEKNVFPLSVADVFNKNNSGNKINNIFTSNIYNNNINIGSNNNSLGQSNHIAILSGTSINNNNLANNNNCFFRNNTMSNNYNSNLNDSQDEQMRPNTPLRPNIYQGNINLKRKKNI